MKHDHKKTKKLKVALFAMFMFLPFIAIGITCLTHVFNEKVAEETETATINYMYETEQPENNQPLKDNYIYKMDFTQINNTAYIYAKYLKVVDSTNNQEIIQIAVNYTYNTNMESYIEYNYDDQFITIFTEFNRTTIDISDYTPYTIVYFVYSEYGSVAQTDDSSLQVNQETKQCPVEEIPIESVSIETTPQDQTTNIFYDSCDQVKQSFILNWCNEENPINSGLANFTQVFNIPNDNIINTLLTYMLSISMIYIVIDIIIETIIYITHFFNKEF